MSEMAEARQQARLRAVAAIEQRITTLRAEQYRLLALIDADPAAVSMPGHPDKRWAVEDVACALRVSPALARSRLVEAAQVAQLPEVLDRMRTGQLPASHVRVLIDAARSLSDAESAAVCRLVLERAAGTSTGAFRARVRRAVLTVASDTSEQRRQANVAERRVCLRRASGDGVSELWALLPDEGAAALMSAIEAFADRAGPGDERTADQRRADALVQLGLDRVSGVPSERLPRTARLRPAIQVSVALSTLLGIDDQPADLDGIGPIPADLARRLAADPTGTWRRLVTDPMGRLIDCGRTRYRPPPELARHVITRDRTCRFPHCTRAAESSELDHSVPWARGGTTSARNLVALCARHHHLRHETRWRYRRTEAGAVEWTSPAGVRFMREPAAYPIDRTGTAARRAAEVRIGSDPDPPQG